VLCRHADRQSFGHNNEVLNVIVSELQRPRLSERKNRARSDITRIRQEFSLYDDQERVFRSAAEHFSRPTHQLHLYLGDMAGTGKTHVIKALAKEAWIDCMSVIV
jgi:DNA replication protein DnaC